LENHHADAHNKNNIQNCHEYSISVDPPEKWEADNGVDKLLAKVGLC